MYTGEIYKNVYGINNTELLNALSKNTLQIALNAGEILRTADSSDKYFFILENGLTGSFFISEDGKIYTNGFAHKKGMPILISSDSSQDDLLSGFFIKALKKSCILRIQKSVISALSRTYPELTVMNSRILIQELEQYRELTQILRQFDAEQRYLWFIKKYPDLQNKAKAYHIASFLNMTPVTLSRIKKNL